MAIASWKKTTTMQVRKNAIIWTAVATTAAAFAIFYFRKKRKTMNHHPERGRQKHLTDVFARAKGVASGEYTL